MKRIILIILSVLLFNCSSDDGGTDPIKPPTNNEKPVAVDDAVTTIEEEELVLRDLLSNDTVITGARITSFDASSTNNGTIEDNRNGTFSYTPVAGFVGEDTFTYTLCDNDSTPDCSTATVTITVTDEGSPIAVDDDYNAVKNTTRTLTEILENDTLTDDAVITSVDNTNATGIATLNNDGSITYVPQNNFIGDDTFTYTICDDDLPTQTCISATVKITVLEPLTFNIPANLISYYSTMSFTTDADLNHELLKEFTIEKHTTILSYGQRHDYLYNADEDSVNTDNVILMYSSESRYWEEYTSGNNSYSPQTFNTEHVYPQSRLEADDAVTDLHHLRSCDATINSNRSNFPFTSGSGTYQLVNSNEWYPGDEWRGDVARMIMYLNIRYGETFDKVGTLDLFLEWNVADPVSSFEIQRNNIIEGAQGNRNPFIDNPYIATLIWGGSPAENKWQ